MIDLLKNKRIVYNDKNYPDLIKFFNHLDILTSNSDMSFAVSDSFAKVDAILTPSTPSSAFKINEKTDNPISMYLNDIFTVPVNLAGLPGISIPSGVDKKGYPLCLQIIGKAFDEQTNLNIAYSMEQKINFKNKITDWWINEQ